MTLPKPLISIIIPHLNQPEYLKCCLASLLDQTWDMSRAEIIVVDNGSDEMPSNICGLFPGVRLEREETPGPGPARNKGCELSAGEILAFIDADCLADKNWVSSLHDVLVAGQSVQIVGGDVRIAVANPDRLTMLEAYESIFAYRQKEYIEQQGFSGTGNLAMRRTAYESVGPFAGIQVSEDRDWGHRATAQGFVVTYLPDMIVYHPARRTMAELFAKWDRHVSHDFEENEKGQVGRLRWIALSFAVVISPLFELRRIIMSDRVTGWRDRAFAFVVLLRIRIYRAGRMIKILADAKAARTSRSWNRN